MIVIADTSPIKCLILIGEVELLHQLYGSVVVPRAVLAELEDKDTPTVVQDWVARRPGRGECDAILLAQELRADKIVIDERTGRRMARLKNLEGVGNAGGSIGKRTR